MDKFEMFKKNALFIKNSDLDNVKCNYIHIRYYAVIQLIHYYLVDDNEFKNHDKIHKYYFNLKSNNNASDTEGGFHFFLIKEVIHRVIKPGIDRHLRFETDDLKDLFTDIRDFRVEADYSHQSLDSKRITFYESQYDNFEKQLIKLCKKK